MVKRAAPANPPTALLTTPTRGRLGSALSPAVPRSCRVDLDEEIRPVAAAHIARPAVGVGGDDTAAGCFRRRRTDLPRPAAEPERLQPLHGDEGEPVVEPATSMSPGLRDVLDHSRLAAIHGEECVMSSPG